MDRQFCFLPEWDMTVACEVVLHAPLNWTKTEESHQWIIMTARYLELGDLFYVMCAWFKTCAHKICILFVYGILGAQVAHVLYSTRDTRFNTRLHTLVLHLIHSRFDHIRTHPIQRGKIFSRLNWSFSISMTSKCEPNRDWWRVGSMVHSASPMPFFLQILHGRCVSRMHELSSRYKRHGSKLLRCTLALQQTTGQHKVEIKMLSPGFLWWYTGQQNCWLKLWEELLWSAYTMPQTYNSEGLFI